MAELTDKLHIKKDDVIEEISLYSTVEEVGDKHINFKINDINCYAEYGDQANENASLLNCKELDTNTEYKVLKTATPSIQVTLKAYRNNENYIQDLPIMHIPEGGTFYINNENAPTIEGFDFVCCNKNNFKVIEPTEVKVYYIPQNVPDRTKTSWRRFFLQTSEQNLFYSDFANTFTGTNFYGAFMGNDKIITLPKINTSNGTSFSAFAQSCVSLDSDFDFSYFDFSKGRDFQSAFYNLPITHFNAKLPPATNMATCFYGSKNLVSIKYPIDFTKLYDSTLYAGIFTGCNNLRGVHLQNVPKNIQKAYLGGIEGETYIIDNYIG